MIGLLELHMSKSAVRQHEPAKRSEAPATHADGSRVLRELGGLATTTPFGVGIGWMVDAARLGAKVVAVIATLPSREEHLATALRSVRDQERSVDEVVVVVDYELPPKVVLYFHITCLPSLNTHTCQ
jgi:hypothetical protein